MTCAWGAHTDGSLLKSSWLLIVERSNDSLCIHHIRKF